MTRRIVLAVLALVAAVLGVVAVPLGVITTSQDMRAFRNEAVVAAAADRSRRRAERCPRRAR